MTVQTNRSAPPATVTPVLVYPDVRAAVAWLEGAFDFGERVRIGDAHRAQMRVGSDGSIVVADVRHWLDDPANHANNIGRRWRRRWRDV